MQIVNCQTIRSEILQKVKPNDFNGKIILAIIKESNGANRSYMKSVSRAAKFYGVHVKRVLLGATNTQAEIRTALLYQPQGTAVLFVGFSGEDRELIESSCAKELKGKLVLDPSAYPDVVAAAERIVKKKTTPGKPYETVIVGRSWNALRLQDVFLKDNHTVTICHTQTPNLSAHCRRADVIVSFAGCPGLIRGDMVKDGALIVGVGCGFKDGKLCGDIDMESMADKNVRVTPTPGGVGIVTTALMFEQLAAWEG